MWIFSYTNWLTPHIMPSFTRKMANVSWPQIPWHKFILRTLEFRFYRTVSHTTYWWKYHLRALVQVGNFVAVNNYCHYQHRMSSTLAAIWSHEPCHISVRSSSMLQPSGHNSLSVPCHVYTTLFTQPWASAHRGKWGQLTPLEKMDKN